MGSWLILFSNIPTEPVEDNLKEINALTLRAKIQYPL